jgi:hypothetical protein
MVLSNHAQKLLGVYTVVTLVGKAWPFPDNKCISTYSLLTPEDTYFFDENVTLVEEGSLSPSHIKYAIVSVDGYCYRVVYIDRGNRLEYSYTEQVVGTPVTTYKWEKVDE